MSFRVSLACTRAQGAAIGTADELFANRSNPPVLVASERDETEPDAWVIHAYFQAPPTREDLETLAALGHGQLELEKLGEADWVTMSQSGLDPVGAGRFFVHTPTHPPRDGAINFEIDAGLAFGTGQHATTFGCLEALDRLEQSGRVFVNFADIGTGTGLLAFAALALWPEARGIATDVDPVAIDVTCGNAAINGVRTGHGPGELLLAVAAGMDHPMIAARTPFDLLIANILAGPLIDLAPAFVNAVRPGATILLSGLLDSQSEAVSSAYRALGCTLVDGGKGEWRVLVLEAPA